MLRYLYGSTDHLQIASRGASLPGIHFTQKKQEIVLIEKRLRIETKPFVC